MARFHCWSFSSCSAKTHTDGPTDLSSPERQSLEGCGADFEATYIQEASIAENTEQRVDVTLAGEIETRPNVAAGRQDAARVPVDEMDR